ncbi:MAG: IS66 family insertion sequence element accessory protein TnpA, partial [Planctomycetaceae bacterium]
MARRRREQLRAEWIDRLRRFQKRSGNVEEFCRAEGVSLAMLYRWRQRLAGTVPGRVAGPRAKVPARVTRKVAPFAAVRIRPVPVTEAALRIVLPNGTLPADRRHTAPRRGCPLKPNRCEVTEADKYVG